MLLRPVSTPAEQHREEKIRVMGRKAAVAAWSLAGRMKEPHGGMKILSALACDGVFLLVFFFLFYLKTVLNSNCF